MTKSVVIQAKKSQKRANSLVMLKDMPNTLGKLQYARDTLYELSLSYFQKARDIKESPEYKHLDAELKELKEKDVTKYINLAKDAMRDMVSVCGTLLPYQSPKLAAVDVRRTNEEVVTVINEWERTMKLEPGADIGEFKKIQTAEEAIADREIIIDDTEEGDNETE